MEQMNERETGVDAQEDITEDQENDDKLQAAANQVGSDVHTQHSQKQEKEADTFTTVVEGSFYGNVTSEDFLEEVEAVTLEQAAEPEKSASLKEVPEKENLLLAHSNKESEFTSLQSGGLEENVSATEAPMIPSDFAESSDGVPTSLMVQSADHLDEVTKHQLPVQGDSRANEVQAEYMEQPIVEETPEVEQEHKTALLRPDEADEVSIRDATGAMVEGLQEVLGSPRVQMEQDGNVTDASGDHDISSYLMVQSSEEEEITIHPVPIQEVPRTKELQAEYEETILDKPPEIEGKKSKTQLPQENTAEEVSTRNTIMVEKLENEELDSPLMRMEEVVDFTETSGDHDITSYSIVQHPEEEEITMHPVQVKEVSITREWQAMYEEPIFEESLERDGIITDAMVKKLEYQELDSPSVLLEHVTRSPETSGNHDFSSYSMVQSPEEEDITMLPVPVQRTKKLPSKEEETIFEELLGVEEKNKTMLPQEGEAEEASIRDTIIADTMVEKLENQELDGPLEQMEQIARSPETSEVHDLPQESKAEEASSRDTIIADTVVEKLENQELDGPLEQTEQIARSPETSEDHDLPQEGKAKEASIRDTIIADTMVEKLENQELDSSLEQTEQIAGSPETSEDHDLLQESEAEEASSRDTIIADTMVEKLENQELDGPLEQTEQIAGSPETSEDHDLPQEGKAEEASSRDTIIADTMVEKLENQELDGPLEQTEQVAGSPETLEDHDLPQEGKAEEASIRDTNVADTIVEKLENQELDSPLEQTEQIARSPETSEDHDFSSSSMVQGQEEEVVMHPVPIQEVSRTKELQVISEEETISEEHWKVGENETSLPQADEAEKISTREITIAHTMVETLEDQKELDSPLAAMEQLSDPTALEDHDASSPLRALNSDQEEEVDMHPVLEKEDSRTHDVHAKYEEEPAQEEPQELEEEHETQLLQEDEKNVSSWDATIEDGMVETLEVQNELHSPTQMELVADSTETSGHDVTSSLMVQTPKQGEAATHPVVVQEDSRTINVQAEYEEGIIIKEDRDEVEEHRSLSLQTGDEEEISTSDTITVETIVEVQGIQKEMSSPLHQTEQIAGCTETSEAYDTSSSLMMQKPKQEEEVSMHSAVVQEDSGATSLQAMHEEASIAREPYKVEDKHKILLLHADESEEVSMKDTTLADTMVEAPEAQKELGNPLWQINQDVGGTEGAHDISSSVMVQSPEHKEEVTIHLVLIQEDSREYKEETIVEEPQEVEHENRSLLLQKDEPEQASIRNATLSDAIVKEPEIQEEWDNPLVQTEQDAGIMKQQSEVEEVRDSKAETARLDEMVIIDYFTCRGSRMDHPDIKEEVMASLVKDGEIDEASEEEKTIGGTSEESLDFQKELNTSVVEEGVVEEPDRSYPAVSLVETLDVQRQKEHVRITTKDLYLGSTVEGLQGRESPSNEKQCVHQEEEDIKEGIALEDALVKPQNIREEFDDPEVEDSELRDKFIIQDLDLAVRVAEREEVATLVSASLIQRGENEVTKDMHLCSAMEKTLVVPVNSPEDACPVDLFEQLALQGTTILELKREVSSKEITIAALKEEIASKEVTIEALKEKVDSDEATRDVNGMISGHALNIEEMIKKVATQEKTIIALEEKIGCRESTEALEEKLADQQTIIVALREKVNNQATIIEALKEKSAGQESTIEALIRELTSCKASEEQARKNSEALEHQFSDLKGKHQSTAVKLRDVSLQYYKELKVKEVILAASKRHEANILKLQGQLDVAMDERRALEATCEDLDRNLIEANDMCATLENKLRKMDLKLKNTDILLSQALSEKSELQQKLKATEDLVATGMVGGTTREVDFKLEELGRLATASDEKVRAQLIIAKLKISSLQQKNDDLEQQLRQSEKKSSDKLLEMEELNKKIVELTSMIQSVEEERELSKSQFIILENEKNSIDSSLSISIKRNAELEEEVKCLVDKLKEQEGSTSMKQEMEELVMISESKRMEAENRVNELELQLETMRGQVKELVEALEVECAEYMNAQEEELNKYRGTEKELSVELKSFHERSAFLEQDLQSKLEKVTELEHLLEEKEKEFQCIWKELEESKLRENELVESLKSVEAQSKISQRKIQEELAFIAERDSQIEEMKKKLEISEKEAYERVASIKAELEISSAVQAKLEDTINEFKTKALDMESKVEKTLEDEAEVAKINSELKHELELNHVKVQELEQKLHSVVAEKEAVEETLVKIKEDNSKGLELLAKMQLQVQEFEVKMEEARVKFQASESEAQVLNAKLMETLTVLSQKSSDLEELEKKVTDLENNEEEVAEAAAKVALLTMDLEESANAKALLEQQLSNLGIKVQELERKAEDSLQQFDMIKEAKAKLEKELDTQRNKFEDLQKLLSSIKGEYGTEVVEHIALYEVDSHVKDLETKLQDAMEDIEKGESAAKKLKEKLELALQDIAQKECEAKELRAKLFSTEEQVESHQRKEEEAVAAVASVKAELMASTIRRTSLEKIISELRNKIQATESKLENLVTEKEAMDEANSKLRSELEMQQAKVDELQLALASQRAEREKLEATRSHCHVSTESSAKEAHFSLQESEDELQLRASRAQEEHNQEIQKLKALIAELKEQLEEYKAENSLASQLDSSLLEDEVTSALTAKISELEEELRSVEERYKHEEEEARSKTGSDCQQDEKTGLLGQPAPQMTLAGQEVKTMDKDNKGKVDEKSKMLAPVATVQLKRKGSLDKKAFVFIFGAIVIGVLSMIGAIVYGQNYR